MAKRVHTSEDYDYYAGRGDNGKLNIAVAVTEDRIGEQGWLGNPYKLNEWGREEAVELFERDLQWLLDASPVLRAKFKCMHGAKIACQCPDHLACHADVIVKKINKMYWESQNNEGADTSVPTP